MIVYEYLVFIGAIGSLTGASLYIRSMLKGGAKPNRVTWFMWSIAPFIATAAEISKGVGLAILPVFMAGFSPFLIFACSIFIKKAYWRLTKFDYMCGILSLLAIILWVLTKEPNVAIVFSIASDVFAAIPTLRKARNRPETEYVAPYVVGIFSASTSFGVAKQATFSALAFPVYLICINVLLILSMYLKRNSRKAQGIIR